MRIHRKVQSLIASIPESAELCATGRSSDLLPEIQPSRFYTVAIRSNSVFGEHSSGTVQDLHLIPF